MLLGPTRSTRMDTRVPDTTVVRSVTASQLSAVVNGFATILLFALIDPPLSVMTDDVVEGHIEESLFRRTIVWISVSRLAGTLLAQMFFLSSEAPTSALQSLLRISYSVFCLQNKIHKHITLTH